VGVTIRALLDDARRRSFVGREAELAAFDAALAGGDGPCLLHVHGPGGMGKTTLLAELRMRARDAGRPVIALDGRDHDTTQDRLREQVHAAGGEAPPVLLVDGYEMLAPLDDWFREELVPSLPAGSVTVLAGRDAPSLGWRSDPGWRRLMRVLPLRDFTEDESGELLARVGVDRSLRPGLTGLARGHPLALALLADAVELGEVPDELADTPDVVEALLPVFVSSVPDDAHALGLEVCAHAWVTTFGLLEHAVGGDADAVWRWLESLPFITHGPLGLYPHDLARDVLRAEHERRSSTGRLRVHRLMNGYGRAAIQELPPADAHVAAIQLLYLHRESQLTRGFWDLRDNESVSILPGRPSDHAEVVEMVRRFEGEAAAGLAARWLDDQPGALRVIHRPDGVEAFALEPLVPADPALEADDGVVRQVLDEMARAAPLRPGERASVGRFFGARSHYQADPYATVCGAVSSLMTWQTRVLAWSWIVTVSPDFWTPIFAHLGFEHRLDVPGDRPRTAFGIDWRRIGVDTWLNVMSRRELSGETGPMPRELLRPPPLDRARFDEAVREALRLVHRPELLAESPLMGSRLLDRPGAGGEALAAALRGGVEALAGAPGDEELGAVLDRTFLWPAPGQEAAANALHLSFSTYRRRLAKALDALVDLLWAVEIGERRLPS
jgi:hypothetical protein